MTYQEAANILGIDLQTVTTDSLKKAYRKAMKNCHPDHNQGNQNAEHKAQDINEANEVLKQYLCTKSTDQQAHQQNTTNQSAKGQKTRPDIPHSWIFSSTEEVQYYLKYLIENHADCKVTPDSEADWFYILAPGIHFDDYCYYRNGCINVTRLCGCYNINGRIIQTRTEFDLADQLFKIFQPRVLEIMKKQAQAIHTIDDILVEALKYLLDHARQKNTRCDCTR